MPELISVLICRAWSGPSEKTENCIDKERRLWQGSVNAEDKSSLPCLNHPSIYLITGSGCWNINEDTRKCHNHKAHQAFRGTGRSHYENTPIQIYWKLHLQNWYFSYFCSKHRLWVLVSSPELCSGWAIVITFRPSSIRPLTFSNDFSSEAPEPILLRFHIEPP